MSHCYTECHVSSRCEMAQAPQDPDSDLPLQHPQEFHSGHEGEEPRTGGEAEGPRGCRGEPDTSHQ